LWEVHDREISSADGLGSKVVGMNVLDYIADQTGLIHHAFHSDGSQFGNALLSLFPFANPPVAHELKSGSVLIMGEIQWHQDHPPVAFGVTRLHHTSEALRLEQMEAILPAMRDSGGDAIGHVLLGTLNALRVEDYTEAEWSALEEDYAYHGFGDFEVNPQGQVMGMLEESGYKDAFVEVGKGGMPTYRWRDVRYDYALASPSFPHQIRHCRRVDSDASDHYAVFVDIKLKTGDPMPGLDSPNAVSQGGTGAW